MTLSFPISPSGAVATAIKASKAQVQSSVVVSAGSATPLVDHSPSFLVGDASTTTFSDAVGEAAVASGHVHDRARNAGACSSMRLTRPGPFLFYTNLLLMVLTISN